MFVHELIVLLTISVSMMSTLASVPTYNVSYMELSYPSDLSGNSTYLTGVRQVSGESIETVYISANSLALDPLTANVSSVAVIYKGSIITGDGEWYTFNYPNSENVTVTGTYFYGPNSGSTGDYIQAVGAYSTVEMGINELGLLYQGGLDGSGIWLTLHPQVLDTDNTVFQVAAHSTMGGLVVGDFYTFIEASRAFVYDIDSDSYNELTYPSAESISAYGIWHDGGAMYTITGGINGLKYFDTQVNYAYVCKWNSSAQNASDWTFYSPSSAASWTHFEGIYAPTSSNSSSNSDNITASSQYQYTFVSDWENSGDNGDWQTSFVIMPTSNTTTSNDEGGLMSDELIWIDYWYPGSINNSANTVYMNYAIGKFCWPDSPTISNGFIATVTLSEDDGGGGGGNSSSSNGGSNSTDASTVVIIASIVTLVALVAMAGVCCFTSFGKSVLFRLTGNTMYLDGSTEKSVLNGDNRDSGIDMKASCGNSSQV